MTRVPFSKFAAVLMIAAMPFAAFAASPVGDLRGGGSSIEWTTNSSGHQSVRLVMMDRNGEVVVDRTYAQARSIHVRVADLGTDPAEGAYTYELTVTPVVAPAVARKLAAARAANDDAQVRKIMRENNLEPVVQSGTVTLNNGFFVDPNGTEGSAAGDASAMRDDVGGATPRTAPSRPSSPKVGVNDQVIADDLIVTGSECVGFDCVDGESFGFDTIKMKENNLRIKAEDTSTGTGFPTTDWQLTFNDSASGGANKFSVEDVTAVTVPLTITGGAPTNSVFVGSNGKVGFRTAAPVLDLHVSTGDTPAIRQEQTNASGFTAQTWDIGANEANWFVRDVTGGSRLPLRIRPGATTSSIDISSDGDVGINTASPNANTKLDIFDTTQAKARVTLTGQEFFAAANTSTDGVALLLGVNRSADRQLWIADSALLAQNSTNGAIRFRPNNGDISALSTNGTTLNLSLQSNGGNVGINCLTPTSDLVIASSATTCATPSSSINAGSAQFTVASSRTFKENIEPISVQNILEKIEKVDVYTYDFKKGPKDRLGLIAEDFHGVFGRGDEKFIDGNDVQMALWLAVQELTAQNKKLQERLDQLEQKQQ